jgi:hypothetical protein
MTEKAKDLLINYRDIINKLKEIGVIRTGKVVSDYGEYVASKKLRLKLANSSVNKGYDAIDKNNKKYEIKTRKATAWNRPKIFPIKQEQLESADYLVYVEFDDDWELVKLLKIPTNEITYNKHNRVIINKNLVEKYGIM